MTKKGNIGKKPLSTLGIAGIALIIIIVVGGITASYIALKPGAPSQSPTATTSPSPTSSPTPTPSSTPTPTPTPSNASSPTPTPSSTPTPTPSPTPTPTFMHTVDYTTMVTGSEIDYWNISVSSGYSLTLTDSMTVSNGSQQLGIWAYNSVNANATNWIWNVNYMNSTFAYYWVNTGGGNGPQGYISCVNGIVNVVVSSTSIEFIGSSSATVSASFQNIEQIQTENGGDGVTSGLFNGGTLQMSYTTG